MVDVCVSSPEVYAAQSSSARPLIECLDAFFHVPVGCLSCTQPACWVLADMLAAGTWLSRSCACTREVVADQMGHCGATLDVSRPHSAQLSAAPLLASTACSAASNHSILSGAFQSGARRLRVPSLHSRVFTLAVDGGMVISFYIVGHQGVQSNPRELRFGADSSVGDDGHPVRGFYGLHWVAWYVVTALPVAWAIPGPDPARARLLLGSLFVQACLVAWAFPEPGPARARLHSSPGVASSATAEPAGLVPGERLTLPGVVLPSGRVVASSCGFGGEDSLEADLRHCTRMRGGSGAGPPDPSPRDIGEDEEVAPRLAARSPPPTPLTLARRSARLAGVFPLADGGFHSGGAYWQVAVAPSGAPAPDVAMGEAGAVADEPVSVENHSVGSES